MCAAGCPKSDLYIKRVEYFFSLWFVLKNVAVEFFTFHLYCIEVEADMSETDISKPGKIKTKQKNMVNENFL